MFFLGKNVFYMLLTWRACFQARHFFSIRSCIHSGWPECLIIIATVVWLRGVQMPFLT